MSGNGNALLKVENLTKHFPIKKGVFGKVTGHVRAVDGVSFAINRGQTLGLVGESGCGKTTAGRCVLRLIEPTGGTIEFEGANVLALQGDSLRAVRRNMQIIFQDPYSSLNPRMTVAGIVGEGLSIHGLARGKALRERVKELLDLVGLNAAHLNRYPHEFSGGQRQRIGIARALALNPKFIVCDEAVSALDVSIQSQIINLLVKLQQELKLSYLFISHDLSVVEHISDFVAVMYLGEIVEMGSSRELYKNPSHPYTQALLSALPVLDPARKGERIVLQGDVPTPINPPSGCRFHTRCPMVKDVCKTMKPPVAQLSPTHSVNCVLYSDKTGSVSTVPARQ